MTDRTAGFDAQNRTTEYSPVGCGEESRRSHRRVGDNTSGRERGRPRPHQSAAPISHQFRSSQSGARTLTGWGFTNKVPVPISAAEGFIHRLRQPPIGTRDNLRATPRPGGKTQIASLSLYLRPCWNGRGRQAFCRVFRVFRG
ncbi:MAG: hypothetical protein GX456_20040 [Verrucomicrobia bacterium]|nr:hypothetical protein [Verrucomicrobiota bacterium]